MSHTIEDWTDRLQRIAAGLDEETARAFVEGLYAAAQRDVDSDNATAEFEREE